MAMVKRAVARRAPGLGPKAPSTTDRPSGPSQGTFTALKVRAPHPNRSIWPPQWALVSPFMGGRDDGKTSQAPAIPSPPSGYFDIGDGDYAPIEVVSIVTGYIRDQSYCNF